jgi:colicin import membrane protein
MRVPSLQRVTAISFLTHVAILFIISVISYRPPTIKPIVYNVSIVQPDAPEKPGRQAPSSPQQAKEAGAMNRQRIVPKSSKPQNRQKVSPKKRPAPAPEKTGPSAEEFKEQKLRELQQQKETQQKADALREQKLREFEKQKALDAIRDQATTRSKNAEDSRKKAQYDQALAEYASLIDNAIREHWVYPDIQGVRELYATVSITVFPSGKIRINKFERLSGNRVFDRSILKAIKDTGAVDPPPFGELLEIQVRFIPDE